MSKPVKLHVYDLSNGLAAQLSMALLGKQVSILYCCNMLPALLP
jgi:hypothetical protein